MTPPGFAILGKSAFVDRNINEMVIQSRKSLETEDITQATAMAAVDVLLQHIMPSEGQSAEWGISALKGPFVIL